MNTHSPQLVLNFATGSVSFPFSSAGAQVLKTELEALMGRLQVSAGTVAGSKAPPQPAMDFWHQEQGLGLEVFCNPNIWSSPHAAKVLVTVKAAGIRIATETELPRLLEDLSQYQAARADL